MFLFILQEASPNAQHEINSPLPRLIDIEPLGGEWIHDKHERLRLLHSSCYEIGDFL